MDDLINTLIADILAADSYQTLTEVEKEKAAEKISERFSEVIFNTTIDNLTNEQVRSLNSLPLDSPEMEKKLTEYASQTPDLLNKIATALKEESENFLKTPVS